MSSLTFMGLFILVKTISHYIFQGKKSLDEVVLVWFFCFFFLCVVSQDFWVAVSIVFAE